MGVAEYVRISKTDGSECKISMDVLLDKTEGCGYWKKGTVQKMIEEGLEVQTPYAIYKKKPVSFIQYAYSDADAAQLATVYILIETIYDMKTIIGVFRDNSLAEEKRNDCQEEINLKCKDLSCDIPVYTIETYKLQ